MEHQAVQEAMRGIAIRTHQEEQYYGTTTDNTQSFAETTHPNYVEGEIPPIPEGPYNDADYAMPTDEGLGYAPEMEELPQAENIIFGKASRAKERCKKAFNRSKRKGNGRGERKNRRKHRDYSGRRNNRR